jgi:hypothetical protein
MARSRSHLGSPKFQVGARLKKLSLFLAFALAFSGSSAVAATKKPSATPTVKATAKATAQASSKPSTSASSKPTTKVSIKAKPKPKPKPKPRKKISVSPSPKPTWPPVGFKIDNGIYAKVPTSKELVGVISAKGNLATQVAACKKFVCGAVQVAAEQGCLWWEIESNVYAQSKELIGNLQTVSNGTSSRELKTILLISPEPLETLEYIDSIEVVCHQETRPPGLQSVTFTRVG